MHKTLILNVIKKKMYDYNKLNKLDISKGELHLYYLNKY